jgi:hypothetical protein
MIHVLKIILYIIFIIITPYMNFFILINIKFCKNRLIFIIFFILNKNMTLPVKYNIILSLIQINMT